MKFQNPNVKNEQMNKWGDNVTSGTPENNMLLLVP